MTRILLSKKHLNTLNILCLLFIGFLFTDCYPSQGKTIIAHEQSKAEHLADLYNTARSPLDSVDLKHIHFFPYDKEFAVKAKWFPLSKIESFDMSTYSGAIQKYERVGYVEFELNNKAHKLFAYQSLRSKKHPIYSKYLFIPFQDLTNGNETYGGGRYIDMAISNLEKGHFVLNFNSVYNPWCAYSDGYSCPIPPSENHLNIEIPVGVKSYEKSH